MDYLSPLSIDQKLAALFEKLQKRLNVIQKETLKSKLTSVRHRLVQLCNFKVLSTIRATQNRIAWEYGPVVILRGNPKAVISQSVHSIVPNEVALLEPYQNRGNFYSLDLFDKDTIILGPRQMLEKHKAKYGNSIHFIEDLSAEERRTLGIKPSK